MNSNLYNTSLGVVVLPDEIKNHLRICFAKAKGADENTEGFSRNKELQNQTQITYKQLKRIKNFFDNFKGKDTDLSWILNGEGVMKSWVDNSLNQMRNNSNQKNQEDTKPDDSKVTHSDLKTSMSDYMRPSKQHKTTSKKHSTSVFESKVVDNLKRINEIMSKL